MFRRLSRAPSSVKKDASSAGAIPLKVDSIRWASTLEDAIPTLNLCVALLSALARSPPSPSQEGKEKEETQSEGLQLAEKIISSVYETFLSTPQKRTALPAAETQFSAFLSHYWENKDDVDPLYKALTAVASKNKAPVFYDAAGHIGNLSALPWRIAQCETYVPIIGPHAATASKNKFDLFVRPACLVEMITAYRLQKPIFVVVIYKPGFEQAEFPTLDQLKTAINDVETRTLGKNLGLTSIEETRVVAMKAIQWVKNASLSQTTSIRWHRGTASQQAELISIVRALQLASSDLNDSALNKKMGFQVNDDAAAGPALLSGGSKAAVFVLGASDVRPEIATDLQVATSREFPEATTRIVPLTIDGIKDFYSSPANESTLVVMLSPKLLTEEHFLGCVAHAYKTNMRWIPVMVDELQFDFGASVPKDFTNVIRSLLKEVATITLTTAKKPDLYRMNLQRLWSKLEFDVFGEFPLLPNVDNKLGSFVQKAREFVPETRAWVFQQVEDWIAHTNTSSSSNNSFLIVGSAGLGKSVIAAEIARRGSPTIAAQVGGPRTDEEIRMVLKGADVVAVHGFRHDDAQLSSGLACIGSLARQIAAADDTFRAELISFLAKRDEPSMRDIKSLLKYAVIDPAKAAAASTSTPSGSARMRLIILDALDECADRDELLDALVDSWSALSTQGWGLLMTSREDDASRAKMAELNPHPLKQDEKANLEDIARYAKRKLNNCFNSSGTDESELNAAAQLIRDNSEGVFLYASLTVSSLLESGDPVTLADIQRLPPGLYAVFCDYFGRVRTALGSAQTFRRVLSPIIAAREPLPIAVWREASGFTASDCPYCLSPSKTTTVSESEREFKEKVVAPMSRLLNITASVTFGHKSMRDFLLESTEARKKGLDVSELDGHEALARTSNQAYVSAIEKNVRCKPWYRLKEDDWEMFPDLRFQLSHGAYHAVRSSRSDLAIKWFTDFQRVYWMAGAANRDVSKLERVLVDVDSVVNLATGTGAEGDVRLRKLELIGEVLHVCASTGLVRDHRELAGQVLGRMGLLDGLFVPSGNAKDDRIDDDARAQWKVAAEEWFRRAASEGQVRVAKPSPRCGLSVVGVSLKRIFAGHSHDVTSAGFSPDGKMVVTSSEDNTARLWDVASGRELKKFEGHSESVISAMVSPDAKMVLTGSDDATARLWDIASGKELKKFEGHSSEVNSAVFSPDGKLVLTSSSDKTARLWDVASGKELKRFEGHSSYILSAGFSPDGKTVLTGSDDNTARMWDVDSGKQLKTFEGHSATVISAVFSPDGKQVLTGSFDKTARLWDVAAGSELQKFEGHSSYVNTAVFSPDGKMVLTGSKDRTAQLWDLSSGTKLKKFEGHSDEVNSAVFSPDGKMLLTSSSDKTARFWDVASGRETKPLEGHPSEVNSAVSSPDSKLVLTSSYDKTARLWDLATGKELKKFEGHSKAVKSAVFSPDGKMALTSSYDKTARLWDVASGKELKKLEGHSDEVNSATFSPDGTLVVTGSRDNTARLWDVASGKELKKLAGHSMDVTSGVFSLDGKLVLTSSWDRTARVWEVASGNELKRFEKKVLSEEYAKLFGDLSANLSRHVVVPNADVSFTLDEILQWKCNEKTALGVHPSAKGYFAWAVEANQ